MIESMKKIYNPRKYGDSAPKEMLESKLLGMNIGESETIFCFYCLTSPYCVAIWTKKSDLEGYAIINLILPTTSYKQFIR
jgi:hypothetical protein